jgi:hypothetical protein
MHIQLPLTLVALACLPFSIAGGGTSEVPLQGKTQAPSSPQEGLVVHEWGTFTSMQGSDGATLEGLQHEEEGLPSFVYSRSKVRDCPLREYGYKGLEVDVARVTEKMETPVTYFYSPTPVRVRARVTFNGGLLSQWFPVSDLLGPPEHARDQGPLDIGTVGKSFLEWNFDVLAPGEGAKLIPAVGKASPWSYARIPNSNVLRTVERTAPRMGPVESEKFLFYRGLGRFALPIRAVTEAGSRVTLFNDGREAGDELRHLFVLHVEDGRGEFSYVPSIAAGQSVTVERPLSPDAPAVVDMIRELRPKLVASLMQEGLYELEATAMALTWEQSYFHTEGLRVLYVVPRRLTDAVLPLEIAPAPRELVRVLVGRLECIAPEVEAEVEHALLNRHSADEAARAQAEQRLMRLGRFLEPHVRAVIAKTRSQDVVASGEELLATL